MKKLSIISISVMFILFALAAGSSAADEAAGQKTESKSGDVKQMMTDEIVGDIKSALDEYEEISNFVPGLKKITDRAGKASYTFAGIKIEALDRVRLEKLYLRVHQEMTRLHTENINRQLDTVRRVQRAGNKAGGGAPRSVVTPPAAPRVPSAPPSIHTVPRPPRPPAAPTPPPKR